MSLDTNELIQRALLLYGHFEPATCALHRQLLKAGDTFLDVGANVGTFSLLAAKLVGTSGSVIAIDANPFVFSRLLQNLALNPAAAACVIPVSAACSGDDGMARLQLPSVANCGLGRLTESTAQDTFVVCTRRLSGLLDALSVRQVNLMKIDVEGHELPILAELFASGIKPTHLIFEYMPDEFPQHQAVIALLRANGYQLLTLAGQAYTEGPAEENNVWATLETPES